MEKQPEDHTPPSGIGTPAVTIGGSFECSNTVGKDVAEEDGAVVKFDNSYRWGLM